DQGWEAEQVGLGAGQSAAAGAQHLHADRLRLCKGWHGVRDRCAVDSGHQLEHSPGRGQPEPAADFPDGTADDVEPLLQRVCHQDRVREYFGLFHILALSMYGVFIALDFVVFYVFWEISLVPMYLLIGIWGGKNRNYASIKFFIYTLVGSVAMLLAILGTYFATGTFGILEAAAAKPFQDLPAADALLFTSLAFWGFFLGFAFKVPSFPFHTWL